MSDAWWIAKSAFMQKPDGPSTRYCGSCRGDGCRACNGWGWEATPGYCLLPATGNECNDCASRKGCRG